jgi:colanic acid biosynthesis glycosyl transferase WcaI
VLLLTRGGSPEWAKAIPGKLFEYMASGRPVLASVPEGLASELVRRTGIGLAVAPDDQGALVEALRLAAESPEAFARRHFAPKPEEISRYGRRRLTGDLARILDEVAGAAIVSHAEPQTPLRPA